MFDSDLALPGERALFFLEDDGDRMVFFLADRVRKTIRNFSSYGAERMVDFDMTRKAYEAARGCYSLSEPILGPGLSCRGTYSIEVGPLGYLPKLRSEDDMKLLARNVCQALSVLHGANLVHMDVRFPNIVQVSLKQFMLIDLETVAESPFTVPEGFQHFSEWSKDSLEGSLYMLMLDLYQLGILLEQRGRWHTKYAVHFTRRVKSKRCSAAEALDDAWLSNPTSYVCPYSSQFAWLLL